MFAIALISACSNQTETNSQNEAPSFNITVSAGGEEAEELSTLVDETKEILQSELFQSDLRNFLGSDTEVVVSLGNDGSVSTKSLDDVLALLSGKTDFTPFPSMLSLTGTYYDQGKKYKGDCVNDEGKQLPCATYAFVQNHSNEHVATHGLMRKAKNSEKELLAIEIGRTIHNRFRSQNTVEKSCAINTLAHEWVHTFSTGNEHINYFIDTVSGEMPESQKALPLASYLIGSAAQCSWLQNKAIIDTSTDAYGQCMAVFGARAFNSARCDKFENGDPVELRSDLPEPAI